MRPTLHGINRLSNVTVEKVLTEKINIQGLINTLEANRDKAIPEDWSQHFQVISTVYTHMFTDGELPPDLVRGLDYSYLEMAQEGLDHELDILMAGPKQMDGRIYYYEYARSLAVEKQASELKEHLDEDSDFI
ncbi:hypothetical protein [Cytobacillus oceanisediminis]|uniref:hypothetical protein n=1 Tax=Cytobacillus oceanisediminis TaxID=665099 RepID=UPI001FB43BF8|nr:hypothetical protein [Cytobacillus oceanisediminis]UOE58154.1 hypothetical protein IRB79_26985 [Cytobacillus oceanisediminis]